MQGLSVFIFNAFFLLSPNMATKIYIFDFFEKEEEEEEEEKEEEKKEREMRLTVHTRGKCKW